MLWKQNSADTTVVTTQQALNLTTIRIFIAGTHCQAGMLPAPCRLSAHYATETYNFIKKFQKVVLKLDALV